MTQTAIDEAFGSTDTEITLQQVRKMVRPAPLDATEREYVLRGAIHQCIGYLAAKGGCDSMILTLVYELNKHAQR